MITIKVFNKRIDARTIFSVLVALIPVLSPYASPFVGIYLEELLLIIMTGVSLSHRKTETNNIKLIPIYLLAGEIIISVFVSRLSQYDQSSDVLVRSVRMLFYLFCICYTSRRLIDLNTTMKAIIIISLYAVAFLIVQTVLYRTTGIYLKGIGNILPLAYRSDFDWQYYMDLMFRPSSIFTEPAAMCEYLIVPLSYTLLYDKNNGKRKTIIAFLLSLGCLLTTSLWGIIIVIIIWSVWLIKVAELKKHFILLVIGIPMASYFAINSFFFSTAMSRIDLSNISSILNSQSFSGRFMGYEALDNLDTFERLFGMGFGNLGIRSKLGTGNSVLYYLLGIGFVGTISFYIACIFSLTKIETLWQKTIFIIMLLLSFGAGILNTCLIMYFFIVTVYSEKSGKLENQKNTPVRMSNVL